MYDSYRELIRSYASYMQRVGHVDTAAAALRTRSKTLLDVIAFIASKNNYMAEELRDSFAREATPTFRFRSRWLAAFGRVCALQATQENDARTREENVLFGLKCLSIANRNLPRDRQHQQFHRLEIELLARQGRIDEAKQALQRNEYLRDFYHQYLLADLDNPAVYGSDGKYGEWLSGFNRPFEENDLAPMKPATPGGYSFDDLHTDEIEPRYGGPKVSVILTSYKPDEDAFLLSVRSILNQSWQNLELLILDDASPIKYRRILRKAEALDPRVRVIRVPVNGGTYRARNVGIEAATGDFITGQDSDDWSHPDRIRHQVEYLQDRPSVPGVVVEAIRTDDRLVRMSPGRIPHRWCEVSLMLATRLARDVGGYLDARKGADSEFRRRVEKFAAAEIEGVRLPLYLIRIGHDSLSRGDFKPGWSHPVRRAFWNASQHWHDNAFPTELRLINDRQPLPVPARFQIEPSLPLKFDVVFISDWRAYGGSQRSMIDQILCLRDAGLLVGVMHLESALSPSKETTRLSNEIQELINNRVVHEVIPDEEASTKVALISDPTILHFVPYTGVRFGADHTVIAPDLPPPSENDEDVFYLPGISDNSARHLFGGEVIWTSIDPMIRIRLKNFEPAIKVSYRELPILLQTRVWILCRNKRLEPVPIIARHAENLSSMWPKDSADADILWPSDGKTEVRVLGDARPYLRKYRRENFPINWVVFRDKEIKPEAFMSSVDFFVYFPEDPFDQSFCREALEAVASGAIAILPEKFRQAHGDLAIYALPSDVQGIISEFTGDKALYRQVVSRNLSLLADHFSAENYIDYISDLCETSGLITN